VGPRGLAVGLARGPRRVCPWVVRIAKAGALMRGPGSSESYDRVVYAGHIGGGALEPGLRSVSPHGGREGSRQIRCGRQALSPRGRMRRRVTGTALVRFQRRGARLSEPDGVKASARRRKPARNRWRQSHGVRVPIFDNRIWIARVGLNVLPSSIARGLRTGRREQGGMRHRIHIKRIPTSPAASRKPRVQVRRETSRGPITVVC
jgi:hypothetical protein